MAFSLKSISINRAFFSLGEAFFSVAPPTPFKSAPRLLHFNPSAAELLNLVDSIEREQEKDYSEIDRLFNLLQHPFDEQPEYEHYATFPPEWAEEISVTCSS